jgi:beta-lactamase regulating signal transducer with metallopeptidase domain
MKMLFIDHLFSSRLVSSISWTLIHSLWQGLILAILAAIIILLTRRSRPQLRYNLLLAIFATQLITFAATFYIVHTHSNNDTSIPATSISIVGHQTPTTIENVQAAGNGISGFEATMTSYFNHNAPLIVTCWFVVMVAMFLKMIGGLLFMQQLRYRKTLTPPNNWQQRIVQLATDMKIHRSVALLESGLTKVPIVIGFFKPLILVPVGLISNLPYNQVEAILVHELAHIRRQDFMVNILQCIVETFFFFNPSVWWISSLLREEREHCCDELVLNNAIDKKTLAEALVSFQQYKHLAMVQYANAFAGPKYKLLPRIQRIFNNKNSTLSPFVKFVLTACIVVSTITLAAFNTNQQSPAIVTELKNDTIPGSIELQRKLQEIDARFLPLERAANEKVKSLREEAERTTLEMAGKTGTELNNLKAKRDALFSKMDELAAGVRGDRAVAVKQELGYTDNANTQAAIKDASQQPNAQEKQAMDDSKRLSPQEQSLLDEQSQGKRMDQQTVSEAERLRAEEQKKNRHEAEVKTDLFFQELINELLSDKIIKARQGVSFMLNKEKLIVNDLEQPAAIQKKFAAKYLKDKSNTIVYRYHSEMIGWLDGNPNLSY